MILLTCRYLVPATNELDHRLAVLEEAPRRLHAVGLGCVFWESAWLLGFGRRRSFGFNGTESNNFQDGAVV